MRIPVRKHQIILLLALLSIIILSACAPRSAGAPSTQSHVPAGSGAAPEPGTDGSAQPLPNGHSESIIVASDLAYIGSDNQTLYAIGTRDGKVHWQFKGSDMMLVYAVANGAVYASANSTLYALNASSGALLWKYQAPQQISQVLTDAGVVYANTAASGNRSTLAALKATDGALLWQYTLATQTPGLQGAIDGTVYDLQLSGDPGSPTAAQTVYAFQGSDGHLLWQMSLASSDGLVNGAPVVDSGVVYFGTTQGALSAFDVNTGKLLWHVARPSTGGPDFGPVSVSPTVANGLVYIGDSQGVSAYRASDGTRQWQYAAANGSPFPAQPTVADGVVYYGAASGLIVALHASDGSLIWQQHAPGAMQPLVVSNGLVISDAGPVYALRASDGSQVWQSDVTPSGLGTPAGKAETVGAGSVYIGSDDGTVHAIQATDGSLLWQYKIAELPVQSPPVLSAAVTFAANVSYQQALEIVTNLGLKTFVACHPETWTSADGKDFFSGYHYLTVAATVNSAPLWLGRLKATPGVSDAQSADGPINCPAETGGNGPPYLPQDQAGTLLRVTFANATAYAAALDSVNALGFRLSDPCYEQARAQGSKPTWHAMSQADAFAQSHALVLATTLYNATTWTDQLKAVAGVVTITAPFQASC